jgi:Domain of unknown function (DUF4283)
MSTLSSPNEENYSKADEYALLRFYPNEENTNLQNITTKSIILTDERKLGALYI